MDEDAKRILDEIKNSAQRTADQIKSEVKEEHELTADEIDAQIHFTKQSRLDELMKSLNHDDVEQEKGRSR